MVRLRLNVVGDGSGMDVMIRVDGLDVTRGLVVEKEFDVDEDIDAAELLDLVLYLMGNGMVYNIHLN